MRRMLWCGVVCLVLMAAAGLAQAATPVIERVDLVRTRDARGFRLPWQFSESGDNFTILVSDADGVGDLASIAVGGGTYLTDSSGGGFAWSQVSPQQLQLTATIYESYPEYSAAGPYTVTVATDSGAEVSLSVAKPALGPAPAATAPAAGYPVLQDPTVTFSWTGTDPAADNIVTVTRASGIDAWIGDAGPGTSLAYNADGTAIDAPLRAGFRYVWSVASRRSVDDGVTDARVHTSTLDKLGDQFIIASGSPAIESVEVDRRIDSNGPILTYGESVGITVTDLDGWDHITSASVTDPAGVVHTLDLAQAGTWQTVDSYASRLWLSWWGQPGGPPLPAGSYTLQVSDASGHTASLATPAAKPVHPVAGLSPADGTVLPDGRPVLRWDSDLPLLSADVDLYEEATAKPIWSAHGLANQARYPEDGSPGADLAAGHTYVWWLAVGSMEDNAVTDNRVTLLLWQTARTRFTVADPARPALPELPGKLVYGLYEGPEGDLHGAGLQQYDPDPAVRRWLGPVGADAPAWSADGTRLAYAYPWGLWIDDLDGTAPRDITGDVAEDPSWSPGGVDLVYARWHSGGDRRELWVAHADENSDNLLFSTQYDLRFCRWSPDGKWIAYQRQMDAAGTRRLWVLRTDGITDNHEITATGVQGYPDYQVDYYGGNTWAPDGGRLAIDFSASVPGDSARAAISGIGVLPVGGGVLRPIFLTPPGIVCCAAPKQPTWSPDGTRIVFVSGHHLPADPDWVNHKFEAGDELWMVSADGSGAPTRLTYDYSLDTVAAWWGPDPFPDVPKGNWAYSAISTCQLAGLVAGYADGYRPGDPVTRDQMAVYLARGLAGGDAKVPTAPAGAVFTDVPEGYWAAKYIAYSKDHGVVQGYSDDTYRPTEQVNRGQMAVYVSRAMAGGDAKVPAGPSTASFTDVATAYWAYKYVEYAKGQAVVSGYSDGTYRPDVVVTRDQMAMYIARAFKLPM